MNKKHGVVYYTVSIIFIGIFVLELIFLNAFNKKNNNESVYNEIEANETVETYVDFDPNKNLDMLKEGYSFYEIDTSRFTGVKYDNYLIDIILNISSMGNNYTEYYCLYKPIGATYKDGKINSMYIVIPTELFDLFEKVDSIDYLSLTFDFLDSGVAYADCAPYLYTSYINAYIDSRTINGDTDYKVYRDSIMDPITGELITTEETPIVEEPIQDNNI